MGSDYANGATTEGTPRPIGPLTVRYKCARARLTDAVWISEDGFWRRNTFPLRLHGNAQFLLLKPTNS
jgi:hypothetical protein